MGVFTRKAKVGLALGGGGARGFAHLGVIKAFEEYGLKFDYICGTSAGSLAGALLSAGLTFDEMYDMSKDLRIKDIRTSKIPLMPSRTDGIQNLLKEKLGDINIEDLKYPFSAIAVDIKNPREVCISHGNLAKAVAGSCCVPGVFVPVEFGDYILCDGGLHNTMPADIPKYFGCDYVVAVDVNKSRLYGTNSTKLVDVLGCTVRILMKGNVVKGYVNADIVIAPETKRFKSTKTDGLDEMIDEGYKAAIDKIHDILELFKPKFAHNGKKIIKDEDILFI